jgi:integrase
VKNRPAIVEPKAVGKLLRTMDGYEGSPVTLAALRLAPLLFVRPGELRQAEWAEIDLEADGGPRWIIPAEKMKMRSAHVVPLSRQAVEIITELHPLTGSGRYLFPCNRTKGRCMSNMTINAALRRLGYEQGEHCAHGFRAMASTLLNEQGWPSDVIERQLAHAPRNKVRATYNRAEHLSERRKMMQAWADYLDALKAGGKVIPMHRENAG